MKYTAFVVWTLSLAAASAQERGAMTVTGELTFAATGDAILLRPVSVYEQEPAFREMVTLLRSATVAFTNFEFNAFDTRAFRPTPQAEHGGLWLHASPREAEELQWMGFDVVSRANNHATDYGVEGMLETTDVLHAIGMVHAGTGRTLGEARAPAYFQTPVGRVAIVSCASTHTPISRAAHQRADMKGRPGLSMLRFRRDVYLDPDTYERLKRSVEEMKLAQPPDPFDDEQMELFGTRFKRGEKNRVELVANERDQEEILAQVRNARRQADFVFVTIHSHEPANQSETPADFLPSFARAAIDAGADLFTGHGPHHVRGIEIYHGRPIFYRLGKTSRFSSRPSSLSLRMPTSDSTSISSTTAWEISTMRRGGRASGSKRASGGRVPSRSRVSVRARSRAWKSIPWISAGRFLAPSEVRPGSRARRSLERSWSVWRVSRRSTASTFGSKEGKVSSSSKPRRTDARSHRGDESGRRRGSAG